MIITLWIGPRSLLPYVWSFPANFGKSAKLVLLISLFEIEGEDRKQLIPNSPLKMYAEKIKYILKLKAARYLIM